MALWLTSLVFDPLTLTSLVMGLNSAHYHMSLHDVPCLTDAEIPKTDLFI